MQINLTTEAPDGLELEINIKDSEKACEQQVDDK